MSLNYNKHVTSETHNYMMQPGDCTLYRFGFAELPDHPDTLVLASGVGNNDKEYLWVYIQMPGGSGCGVMGKWEIWHIFECPRHLDYLSTHGFEAVTSYTLAAVVLALGELMQRPGNLDQAAERMLKASELLQDAE